MTTGKTVEPGPAQDGEVRRQGPAELFRSLLDLAIDGRGRLQGAVAVARRHLEHSADARRAVHDVIEQHVRLAGAQGFLTGLGGFAALPLALPANLTGLAVLQARMVAAIAHLHGYDLADARVRTAVTACLLGPDTVRELVAEGRLPSTPLAIATAPVHDPELDRRIAGELGTILAARVGGKRLGVTVARRLPLVGGGVGAVVDGIATHRIGRFAEAELPDRTLRRLHQT